MHDLKNALIASVVILFVLLGGFAIWAVRSLLPVVGIVLLAALVIGILLGLVWLAAHVYQKFNTYHHIPIAQYGSVLHRGKDLVQYAPYHPVQSVKGQQYQDVIEGEAEEIENEAELMSPILTFRELFEGGSIQRALKQGKMILGYIAQTHELRYGSWLDLYSTGNGGVSGSGKSTTTRFMLFQAILAGARLVMIDPHIGDPKESLAYQFSLLPPYVHQIAPSNADDKNLMKRVNWLQKEVNVRKKTKINTQTIIFVVDEFNSVMRHASKEVREALSTLLLDIEQEGRKFGIFALLIGQRWSAQDLGGADIRTSLASKMGHRFSDEDQAVRFMGRKHGPKLLELETGHWFFYDTQGKTVEMITPETWAEDGALIAEALDENTPEKTVKSRENTRFYPETTGTKIIPMSRLEDRNYGEYTDFESENTDESTESDSEIARTAIQIMAMMADGASKNEIMREIWGVNPGGTDAYKAAQEEYQGIMRYIHSKVGA